MRSQLLYLMLTMGMLFVLQLATRDRTTVLPFLAVSSAWAASIFMFGAGPLASWRVVLAVLAQGGLWYLFHQFVWSRL